MAVTVVTFIFFFLLLFFKGETVVVVPVVPEVATSSFSTSDTGSIDLRRLRFRFILVVLLSIVGGGVGKFSSSS